METTSMAERLEGSRMLLPYVDLWYPHPAPSKAVVTDTQQPWIKTMQRAAAQCLGTGPEHRDKAADLQNSSNSSRCL